MEMDKTLLKFSIPLFAGNIMQNLYNIFDTAVVGHILGKNALAAVGNSYVPTLIVGSIILGLSSGILILLAQVYGSGETEKAQNCMGSIQTLVLLIGGGLACLFFLSARGIFMAMDIPAEAMGYATDYLFLCVSLYLLTNFLRGAGEIGYPLFNTLLELSFRTVFAFASVQYIGFSGIMLCRSLSFVISTVSLSCRYLLRSGGNVKGYVMIYFICEDN